MIGIILSIIILIVGLAFMIYSSGKAIEHTIIYASILKISPLMIGFVFVSIGTDLPEIANSIMSCALGHGNIALGDALGSVLTQLTLVLGILIFFGSFKIKRKEISALGACLVLSLIMSFFIVGKGYITRLDALFLIGSWFIYILIIYALAKKGKFKSFGLTQITEKQAIRNKKYHITIAIMGFIGVAIGAYFVVQSVISLAKIFNMPEYILSFFLVAIGTSLPELVVDFVALRKKQYGIMMGDIIGSCVLDASFAVGIGQFFFPQSVSGAIASNTILYIIFATIAVISILALRKKVDKKTGIIFIVIYALSYLLII